MPAFSNSCKRKLNCHWGLSFYLTIVGSKVCVWRGGAVRHRYQNIRKKNCRSAAKELPSGVDLWLRPGLLETVSWITRGNFTGRKNVMDSSLMASWIESSMWRTCFLSPLWLLGISFSSMLCLWLAWLVTTRVTILSICHCAYYIQPTDPENLCLAKLISS